MAKINGNLLVRGASGNMAKQFVYRKRGKDTILAKMPEVNKDAVPTDKQETVREQFAIAAAYAKGVISNPELKKEYQKKTNGSNTAYNIAFRDFLKAPVVKRIDAAKYNGQPDATIEINAKDDFRVVEVAISIYTAAGELIEEGKAVLNPINLSKWVYTVTKANASITGTRISATALDLPGNKGFLDITL